MKKLILFLPFVSLFFAGEAQQVATAFPSLQLPVDARSAALAGATTALSADISSVNANPARLALIQSQHSVSFDFLPFKSISTDAKKMAIKYGIKTSARSTAAISLNYYTTGQINLRNDLGATLGSIKQSEYFFTLSYGLQVGSYGYAGASLRYLYQGNLVSQTDNLVVSGGGAIAADFGYLQSIPLSDDFEHIKLGASLTNVGSKLSGLYQPMNLSLAATYNNGYYDADRLSMQDFAFLAGIQLDKPMIPSMPLYDANGQIIAGKSPDRSVLSNIVSTWSDAPGGFKENIPQIRLGIYAETMFQKQFAIRAGYAYEDPLYGSRNYASIGAGVKWEYQDTDYTLNFSFQQPMGKLVSSSPLRNAYSLQFLIQFGEK